MKSATACSKCAAGRGVAPPPEREHALAAPAQVAVAPGIVAERNPGSSRIASVASAIAWACRPSRFSIVARSQ